MATNFQALLDTFRGEDDTCGDLRADGRLFLAPLIPCNRIPTPVTVTLDADLALTDETIDVSITVDSIILERGRVLFLNATDFVVVATEIEVTTGATVSVPIEPSTVAATTGATFDVIERLETLSIESANLNLNVQTEESNKVRQGLRKNMRVTGLLPQLDTTVFFDLDDGAIWRENYFIDGALRGSEFWAYQTFGGGEVALMGPVIATSLSISNTANTLAKISTQITFNDEWRFQRAYRQLSTAEQAAANEIRACIGLAALM